MEWRMTSRRRRYGCPLCFGVVRETSGARGTIAWRTLAVSTLVVCLWALVPISASVRAKEVLRGPFVARPVAVHDGDTLTVRARIWLDQEVVARVRISGIDAPELHGRCRRESTRAVLARDMLTKWVAKGPLVLSDIHYGKYAGRIVAVVTLPDGRDAASAMLAAHLARPYKGGKREGWC